LRGGAACYKRAPMQILVTQLKTLRAVAPLLIALALGGCETLSSITPWNGKDENLKPVEDISSVPVEELYNRGVDALSAHNYRTAASQFDLVEQNYPYSTWAVNAQLMQGYAEYLQNKYTDAIGTLDRFIQLHPAHRDTAYAYYLRALCYYEQIADIQRDQKGTQEALGALQEVVNRYPDSAFARDARLKIDLARDHLAGKEMEVGRWYEKQRLYAAALGRFQRVVDDFQTTNHVPEALHRLTEIYLILGLTDEARRTAAVLGHNYPGSEWYQDSYNDLLADGDIKPASTETARANEPPAERPGLLSRTFNSLF
jgi:outer membrane protein assembly factor BamD